jgi:hypothetical protein
MHRLAGWLGHGTSDATQTLELMLSHCSVARPSHTHTDAARGLAANLPLAMDGALAVCHHRTATFCVSTNCRLLPAAEALLKLWRRHGRDTPKHIHGNFALAVLDQQANSVFLALDRIGAEKLAFAASRQGMVFSSQADMVAAHPAVGRELDPQGSVQLHLFLPGSGAGQHLQGRGKTVAGAMGALAERRAEPWLLLGAEIPGCAA